MGQRTPILSTSPERPLSSGAHPVLLMIEYIVDTDWEKTG
jgi:hypothetical protein